MTILPRYFRAFRDVPEWPYGIRAKAVKLRLEDEDDYNYLGLYNAILSHVFQTSTTPFSVTPSFLSPGRRTQVNVPPATFLVYHRDRLVLILQINPPHRLQDPLARQRAEWNLKEQIHALRDQFVTSSVWACTCFGKWASYYELSPGGPQGYEWAQWGSDPGFDKPDGGKDKSPLGRWDTNVLMPDGRKKLFELVDKIREMVDGLGDGEVDLEEWQDEES
ncbi:hypothetical protein CALCODRAFT_342981 [Calocera cornea HHB12733]|uniref:Uncharacterized protein n=1 Tax=Calocera cornea HHB12733 TaxID=1353952 RepID=A0A165EXH1_9BASI|nr:hypothetical protein CALCODRAFT_342981 [Calocera cornea HHB12733]